MVIRIAKLSSEEWRFSLKVVLPVIAATLLVLSITVYGLLRATREVDRSLIDRQSKTADVAIAGAAEEVARVLETVAVWDDAVIHTNPSTADPEWIAQNIGNLFFNLFDHNLTLVIDSNDRPIFFMRDGVEMPPSAFDGIRQDLTDVLAAIRNPSLLPQPGKRKSTGLTVSQPFLRLVEGRPAAAAIVRIVPHSMAVPGFEPGAEALVLSIRFLDAGLLNDLRSEDLLDDARFSIEENPAFDEYSKQLLDEKGNSLGYIIWRPHAPGSKILSELMPFFLFTTGFIAALMFLLMKLLQRSSNELRAREEHARHLAFHDPLTGQANRAQFTEKLAESFAWLGDAPDRHIAVLLLDLDRFKQVNDTLGHQAGDALLREFGERLAMLTRRGDLVARLGGDEFAVLQLGVTGVQDSEALCRRILKAVEKPFAINHHTKAHVGVSIGVAIESGTAIGAAGMLRRADIALYQAKSEGKGRFCFFDEEMDDKIQQRANMEAELRIALDQGDQFLIHYQPQFSIDGNDITGIEAFLRWNHPTLGILTPSRFLHIAEETGLSVAVDELVLNQICSSISRLPPVPVAVNLSLAQFLTEDLGDRLIRTVKKHNVPAERIELEIPEHVLFEADPRNREILIKLHNFGFKIAIVNSGSRYQNINHLDQSIVNKIKINRELIEDIGKSPQSRAVIKAIIGAGRALGLTVVAEGVESLEQHHILAEFGCNQIQGYLFSKPDVEAKLLDNRADLARPLQAVEEAVAERTVS